MYSGIAAAVGESDDRRHRRPAQERRPAQRATLGRRGERPLGPGAFQVDDAALVLTERIVHRIDRGSGQRCFVAHDYLAVRDHTVWRSSH